MASEPAEKRAIAFFDGQNLYHTARNAFGYTYPNYDPLKLAQAICHSQGWRLQQTFFYTGVPDTADNAFWHHFWEKKLAGLGRRGVAVYSRSLRYRNKTLKLADGTEYTYLSGEEKGIDVRIALDVMSMAYERAYDVALIFSQDQDLSEVAAEIRRIARKQDRWIKVASAFPISPTVTNHKGINRTDWIKIDRALYDSCTDPRDYRPKQTKTSGGSA